ncbi:factor-independent urate hydroxylase [uncultured Jatrophihabitans sp.]|uniref:factor-independent urate hydroxylase n=1 Tax=uncultured Jatrophihabitans sp. TaxID=1610747 RepID=UPI0035CBCD97
MVQLGPNRYGKAETHVVHVARGGAPDGGDLVTDRTVSTSLSGELAATHLTGDNSAVLATDTQKNTAFVFAKTLGAVPAEAYALALAEHFVSTQQPITRARVHVAEASWTRSGAHSFCRSGAATRTTTVVLDADLGASVVSGVEDLVVLNTTNSEFWGFPRDEYTTLAETKDRILATEVSARWRYRGVDVEWTDAYGAARAALADAFADTYSYSLQQTLFAIGTRIVESVPDICEVRLALPNKHHFLVDLAPFGLSNDNEVYWAADRPYGLIEGTVLADDAPPEGLAWV